MDGKHFTPNGLWLPLITPFRDGELDRTSLHRLVTRFAREPINGIILAATTGEGLVLDDSETERLVSLTRGALSAVGSSLPLFLGVSGSDTRRVVKALTQSSDWGSDGYLIACPYYTRPSQEGLRQHFEALADSTSKPIMIYNIPYRTGVNLGNDTMFRLAEHPMIVGVKDCATDVAQSFDLIRHKPEGFSVLTGEDAQIYTALVSGADGAIAASAHIRTSAFASIGQFFRTGDQTRALVAWRQLADLPRLLFSEPSPGPIKYWLWRAGLIASPEMRLPMVPVTPVLASRIEHAMAT